MKLGVLTKRKRKNAVVQRLLTAMLLVCAGTAYGQTKSAVPDKVIDMHVHAYPFDWVHQILGAAADRQMSLPDPPNIISGKRTGATSDEALLRETLAAMKRHNIVLAVASGPLNVVHRWKSAAPDRFVGSPLFPIPRVAPYPDIESLEQEYRQKKLGALGEITAIYEGLSPSDAELEPYMALAEKLSIPVGIHTGIGIAGAPFSCCPKFRIGLGSPLKMEELLVRHPRLRVWVMHAGYPYLDDTIALMNAYPDVYADLAAIDWLVPKQDFLRYLKSLVDAGMGKRLMFGTDQIVWPDAFGIAIDTINSAEFLTPEQKRDIFYNNAARFLRLDSTDAIH